MLNRITSRILEKDIVKDIHNVDSLMKTVLATKAPHLYYSYLQMQNASPKTSIDKFDKSKVLLPSEKDIWIFGYGSLVWKADFPYIAKLPGFITGYERKFYQNSIDHRGVPTFPGRVVTLVPTKDESSRVYGVAYRIAESNKDEVLKHLDYREKNGYDRCSLKFNVFDVNSTVNVIMYVANSDNDSFAGHISNENEIAEQIYRAVGPSGFNREYVYNLEEAMTSLFPGVEDHHLHNLVRLLRNFEVKDKEAIEKCISHMEQLTVDYGVNSEVLENEIVCLLLTFIERNK
ncbi:CHAC2 family protein [Megaselia abdita]